jgi:cytidylate kinase
MKEGCMSVSVNENEDGSASLLSPLDFSMRYHTDADATASAMSTLRDKPYRFLAMSGHLGSGKDTVAPLLVRHFGGTPVHEFFAEPLKDEINQVIRLIYKSYNVMHARSSVATVMKVGDMRQSIRVVRALYDDVKNGVVKTAYDRTPSTRDALQLWGTEVRRAENPDYWVDKAMNSSIRALSSADGDDNAVYVTDARFTNELDAVRALGGLVIRLEVGREEQGRRILKRDGTVVTDEMRNHISETEADHYPHFDVVMDTDGKTPVEISNGIIAVIENECR